MSADSAPHWLDMHPADFDPHAKPIQAQLSGMPAPAVRPGKRAPAGAQLDGQADIFAVLEGEAS